MSTKLDELSAKYESVQSKIAELNEQLETVSIDTMIKTRAELMIEFKEAKSSKWELEEAIEL